MTTPKLLIKGDDRICVSGLPRAGKTVFLRWMLHLAEPNIYIIDPLNQYEEFGDTGDVLQGGKRFIPIQETPGEVEEICRKMWRVSNKTLAVEEMEQYIAQGKALLPATSGLIRMGRNWGIGVWGTTRRIQDINKRFFDLCQHIFFFRCGLKSRDYIAGMIGAEYVYPAYGNSYNKTGYTLTTLPPFHCIHFNLEDESAQVVALNLGTPHQALEQVGKTSEAPKMENRPKEDVPKEDGDDTL